LPKVYEAIDRIGVRDEWRLGLAGAREAYAKGTTLGTYGCKYQASREGKPYLDATPTRRELWLMAR